MAQPSGLDSFDESLASDAGFEESLLAIQDEGLSFNLIASSSKHAAEHEHERDTGDDGAYEITGFGEGGELQIRRLEAERR